MPPANRADFRSQGSKAAFSDVMRKAACVFLLAVALGCSRHAGDDRGARPVVAEQSLAVGAGALTLPNALTSVKFAVIGDSGRGTPPQYDVARQMSAYRQQFPFAFVIMNGDNIYEGRATAEDYREKFEKPYQPLLAEGVKFYAALGNHDDPAQVHYPAFNMGGHRYYTFRPPEDPVTRLLASVRFFAIDTTMLDRPQLEWLEQQLRESDSSWKICFLHHPLYTSGRYQRAAPVFRMTLEPLFVKYGVDVVFAGHEHFYERTTLQQGIQYFVSGGAGSLRAGDAGRAPFVAKEFDSDYHFMLVEIERDVLSFQAISRTGETVDAGSLRRARDTTSAEDTARLRPPAGRVP
jgi:calcineurin-like phosphoesterase family protein